MKKQLALAVAPWKIETFIHRKKNSIKKAHLFEVFAPSPLQKRGRLFS
jgi:hypothetical protein